MFFHSQKKKTKYTFNYNLSIFPVQRVLLTNDLGVLFDNKLFQICNKNKKTKYLNIEMYVVRIHL